MSAIPAPLLSASVTLLIGFFYFYTAFRVGNLRGKHDIKAPATSGHPEFDRAYRVQLNTLEQMGLFLPFLWVATFYPISPRWIAPLIGIVWLIGRIFYLRSYMSDPAKRVVGAGINGLCSFVMLIISVIGVVMAWMAVNAA